MMTANDKSEGRWSLAPEYEHRRLKLIIADGSPQYLDTVRTVLDFHNIVDLLGRAANFQETIQLAASLLPDLVLMDFEMPAAMVAIAAIVTAAPDVQIVGIFNASIPLHTPGLILSVNAFIDKAIVQRFVAGPACAHSLSSSANLAECLIALSPRNREAGAELPFELRRRETGARNEREFELRSD